MSIEDTRTTFRTRFDDIIDEIELLLADADDRLNILKRELSASNTRNNVLQKRVAELEAENNLSRKENERLLTEEALIRDQVIAIEHAYQSRTPTASPVLSPAKRNLLKIVDHVTARRASRDSNDQPEVDVLQQVLAAQVAELQNLKPI